jgi:hypothetical protein
MKAICLKPPKRLRPLRRVLLIAFGLNMACGAQAGGLFFYKFTTIADSAGGFPFQSVSGFPSINSDGLIAYHGTLTGGVEGIFTSKVFGDVRTLADTGSTPYDLGFSISPAINDTGQVSFTGLSQTPDASIGTVLRGQGNSSTALVDSPFHLTDYFGTQIAANGAVVSLATREDGGHAVIVQGPPPLRSVIRAVAVDKPNTDMDQALVVSSIGCAPSINNDQIVAFSGVKTNGDAGIFTADSVGNFTQIVGVDGLFAGFCGLTLNESGSIDKVGMVLFQTFLRSGDEALYLWNAGSLAKIADIGELGALLLGGFAMDYRGQVVYEVQLDETGQSAVYRGPHSLFGRVVGAGDVLFGRTVFAAHIDRGAINFQDQLAVWLIFTDGTEMIVRGDPTSRLSVVGFPIGVLQATTGKGSSVSVSTPIATPPTRLALSFDLTFLSGGGTLDIKLGDTTVKSIAAEELGVRRHISTPIDLRKTAKNGLAAAGHVGTSSVLQFVLSGKAGLTAQIGDVRVPGVFSDSFQSESLARWRINKSAGGSASVVNAGRLPVDVHIMAEKYGAEKSGVHLLSVTVSGKEGFEVSSIERATLRLAGSPPRTKRDATGHEVPACEATGKAKELVCQFEVKGLSAKNRDPTLTLEAATNAGWGITGSGRVHLP